MKPLNACPYFLALTLWLTVSAAHAEIYKWVDENGRTHYSEKKPEGKTAPVEVKITARPSPPATTPPPANTTPTWQEQERQLRQRKAEEAIDKASTQAAGPPRSISGGKENGTDVSRCNLAKDILNGALKHPNGAPIDKYDIDTAKSDVRQFCR